MDAKQRWVILLIVYLLFLAIGCASLLAALGFFPDASQAFKDWSVAVLFAHVGAAAIAVFETQFASKEARLYVNVAFDGDIAVKKKGKAAVVRGPGGWQIWRGRILTAVVAVALLVLTPFLLVSETSIKSYVEIG